MSSRAEVVVAGAGLPACRPPPGWPRPAWTCTWSRPAPTPLELRRPVDLGDGLFVCGDHRDTPSIRGAMASGGRAVLRTLRTVTPPDDRSTS